MTATTRGGVAGPLDIALQSRLAAALSRARELLSDPADGRSDAALADAAADATAAPPGDALRDVIDALNGQIAGHSGAPPGAAVQEQRAALERLRRRYDARFEALAAVRHAIGELRAVTSPASMLAQAPAAVCAASKLRRVVLSLTQEGRLVAEAAHFADDRSGAARVVERSAPPMVHRVVDPEA
jgi:hypothetical protein